MNLGTLMIYLATAAGVAVTLGTLFGRGKLSDWHKWVYIAMAGFLTVAMADLLYLFLTHRFEYSYVYGYSSRDSSLGYLISSSWAGQEGTFLLWAFFGAILGLFLLNRKDSLTRQALGFFVITQLFLLVLMIVKSPFATLPTTPPDGRGLNPLLQDPWMVIHPPIIFIGYAALAIPFAQAMAVLVSRKFERFAAIAFPWAAFSVASLGAGIFIGGFWAYKVLGWGGYWGWDPVENASLIPWLTVLALLHGLILFRMQPKLLKTSLALAIVSYLLVVYGTFLTRSGVLAEFSVHSFADLGINAYLVVYTIGITVLSLGLLFLRTMKIPTEPISRAVNSREFGIVLGILLLVITAALVLVGTSAPLLTSIGGQPANVTISYYNTIAIPLGILIVLTLTLSPFLIFGQMPWNQLFREVALSLVIASAATAGAIFLGVMEWEHLLLIFGSVGALVSNISVLIRFTQGIVVRMGGYLTHAGFALMLMGIVASSGYSKSHPLALVAGQGQEAFGYQVVFNELVEGAKPNENYLDMYLVKGDKITEAKPRLYYSDYTQSVMRNPHIVKGLFEDIYIAPQDYRPGAEPHAVQLVKSEPITVGDWELIFKQFSMGQHGEEGAMSVAAVIDARRDGDTIEISPVMVSGSSGLQPEPMTIPGTEVRVSLLRMQVESKRIELLFEDPDMPVIGNPATLALDIATKPLVNWVWAGVTIITLGSLISFVRRWRETEL